MAFNKAERLKAKELLKSTPDTKSYKRPKVKRKAKKSGPHTLKRQVPKKLGPLTKGEQIAVEALVVSVTPDETEEQLQQRGRALGIALRRSPEAIRNQITEAQERIASRATLYVDLHLQAATVAAGLGDAKPAQWAIERLSAPAVGGKGKRIHVVEPVKTADTGTSGPTVNIGVALGGVTPGASLLGPKIAVEVIDVKDNE